MTVIPFPPAKGLLDFDGMGIKIDVEQQRDDFNALFASVQIALRFCNLDYVEAGKMVRKFIDADILDETGVRWTESVEYLESIVATIKAALVRLEVSEDKCIGAKEEEDMMAKLTDREWQRDLSVMAPPAIATDALADLVFSMFLDREDELLAEVEAGIPRQDELDVVRALLRLILSPNVRMPLSRLQ